LINGYCFAAGETNPVDWCVQCLPQKSPKTWSRREGNTHVYYNAQSIHYYFFSFISSLLYVMHSFWCRVVFYLCYHHTLQTSGLSWFYFSISAVNHPPKFRLETEYYAVLEETLELTIKVEDPEGMPVTVSLREGSPSNVAVQNNVLIWKATSDSKTQFFLKATDTCQATSYATVNVSLRVCPCKNNGRCVPYPPRGSGFYECECVPGYTGDRCQTPIDDCLSYPCLRGNSVYELTVIVGAVALLVLVVDKLKVAEHGFRVRSR